MGIRKLCIFVVYFGHKGKYTLRFVPFYTMDVSRCVLITVEQQTWKSVAQYLSKRTLEYNWIVNRAKDTDRIEVFVWWVGKGAFFATPLGTHLRRLRRKSCTECFEVSKAVKTKSVLKKLARSTETHHWDGGFVGNELMEYLKVGFLEVRKSPKIIKKAVEQEGDGPPPPPPPPPLPPSPPPPPSDVRNSDNRQQVKLNQNQVNGLVLRLLTRAASNVTGVSDELKSLGEAFRDQMISVNSKMDKLAEQLYHKLYDPMFDGDCKCEKCK